MTPLTPARARQVFLLLTLTRWFPVGLVVTVTTLLPIERGLSVTEALTALSVTGLAVFLLELPTGGLADSLGRRPLLVAAAALQVLAAVLFLTAQSFWTFAVAAAVTGVFRALDSGPLEAWFVDTVHATEPGADVDRSLAAHSTVLGASIAAGALVSGGLVWWHPFDAWSALTLPYAVYAGLAAVHLVAVAMLVREPPRILTPSADGDASGAPSAAPADSAGSAGSDPAGSGAGADLVSAGPAGGSAGADLVSAGPAGSGAGADLVSAGPAGSGAGADLEGAGLAGGSAGARRAGEGGPLTAGVDAAADAGVAGPGPVPPLAPPGLVRRVLDSARRTPGVVRDGLRLARDNRVLRWLLLVEVFWSIGMVVFETFQPIRLSELLGDTAAGAAVSGPAAAAGWAVFAGGAALTGLVTPRLGVARTAILARILNGLGAVWMGLALGPVGLIGAYLVTYGLHGACGPAYQALLHREAESRNRSTVLSMASMLAFAAFSLAAPTLGWVADLLSTQTAMVLAGALSTLGAACFLPALRQERRRAAAVGATPAAAV